MKNQKSKNQKLKNQESKNPKSKNQKSKSQKSKNPLTPNGLTHRQTDTDMGQSIERRDNIWKRGPRREGQKISSEYFVR